MSRASSYLFPHPSSQLRAGIQKNTYDMIAPCENKGVSSGDSFLFLALIV